VHSVLACILKHRGNLVLGVCDEGETGAAVGQMV
jgi:hypothetical protein